MAYDVVREGRAALTRLRKGSRSWHDWISVGHALVVGREFALRRHPHVPGGGYTAAFNDWLIFHGFIITSSQRSKLVMGELAATERWRAGPDAAAAIEALRSRRDAAALPASHHDQAAR